MGGSLAHVAPNRASPNGQHSCPYSHPNRVHAADLFAPEPITPFELHCCVPSTYGTAERTTTTAPLELCVTCEVHLRTPARTAPPQGATERAARVVGSAPVHRARFTDMCRVPMELPSGREQMQVTGCKKYGPGRQLVARTRVTRRACAQYLHLRTNEQRQRKPYN